MLLRVQHGKGNKDRFVPLSRRLLDQLRSYWKATRPVHWLFPGQKSRDPLRNRHCPKCQGAARAAWLDARRGELLPVEYFHVVFTIPEPVAALAWTNHRVVYDILFRAAAHPLEGLPSGIPLGDHRAGCVRVPAAISPACFTQRVRAHSALRTAGQSAPHPEDRALSGASGSEAGNLGRRRASLRNRAE